jgi:hypothetical protein
MFMARLREKELEGKVTLVLRFRLELEAPRWMKSNVFRGTPKFDFLAYNLSFKFTRNVWMVCSVSLDVLYGDIYIFLIISDFPLQF